MALGYSGFAQIIDDGGDPVTLLTTSLSINPELNPIISQSAVGYGWMNAADASHYANGVRNFRGSIAFDMQGSTVWSTITKWALTERVAAKAFRHSPDGTRMYEYGVGDDVTGFIPYGEALAEGNKKGAWCESFGLSTSADSVVQANLGVLALTRKENTTDLGYTAGYFSNTTGYVGGSCTDFSLTEPLNAAFGNVSPIPFWKTNAEILIAGTVLPTDVETVSWGVDLSNNPTIIKTCNGLSEDNYGIASAVVMGPMSVGGNVELYKHSGVWDPVLTYPLIASTASFVVEITVDGGILSVTLPAIRLDSDSYDMNITGPTNRKFNIKAMGGKCGTGDVISAPMVMASTVI